jgi:endonuclease/exonuclease/phosphatase family metal-dependent hydrolase
MINFICLKTLDGKYHIQHNLHPYYGEIKSFAKKKAFIDSNCYALHQQQINDVINGLEWNNTLFSDTKQKDVIRIVSWNIERGKQLDAIINFFKEDSELSKADVILAIECDNGMGRTTNRNVARELAESLGMNYCFAPSYLVLGKGALGETAHTTQNTTSLHGTAILSKYPIQMANSVAVPSVKEVFHSSEKRLGCKKGLVVQIQIGNTSIALGAIHIDLSSDARDRAEQLETVINALPKTDIQLIGGDFNCSTFNLRTKWGLFIQVIEKFFTVGFKGAIENYMTPELKFDKPMFDKLLKHNFEFNAYNDRQKGTLFFDITDLLQNEKTKKFVPPIFIRYLERKLRPWNGNVPLKLDWLAGKGGKVINAQTVENPKKEDILLSDHNPIFIDLQLK